MNADGEKDVSLGRLTVSLQPTEESKAKAAAAADEPETAATATEEKVARPKLGFNLGSTVEGLLVVTVFDGQAAARAGIRPLDYVTKIANVADPTLDHVRELAQTLSAESRIPITVLRDNALLLETELVFDGETVVTPTITALEQKKPAAAAAEQKKKPKKKTSTRTAAARKKKLNRSKSAKTIGTKQQQQQPNSARKPAAAKTTAAVRQRRPATARTRRSVKKKSTAAPAAAAATTRRKRTPISTVSASTNRVRAARLKTPSSAGRVPRRRVRSASSKKKLQQTPSGSSTTRQRPASSQRRSALAQRKSLSSSRKSKKKKKLTFADDDAGGEDAKSSSKEGTVDMSKLGALMTMKSQSYADLWSEKLMSRRSIRGKSEAEVMQLLEVARARQEGYEAANRHMLQVLQSSTDEKDLQRAVVDLQQKFAALQQQASARRTAAYASVQQGAGGSLPELSVPAIATAAAADDDVSSLSSSLAPSMRSEAKFAPSAASAFSTPAAAAKQTEAEEEEEENKDEGDEDMTKQKLDDLITQTFAFLDKNNDMRLSRREVSRLRGFDGSRIAFELHDVNGDDSVSMAEFSELYHKLAGIMGAWRVIEMLQSTMNSMTVRVRDSEMVMMLLQRLYDALDADGNHALSVAELVEWLGADWFAATDANEDNAVDFDEFCSAYQAFVDANPASWRNNEFVADLRDTVSVVEEKREALKRQQRQQQQLQQLDRSEAKNNNAPAAAQITAEKPTAVVVAPPSQMNVVVPDVCTVSVRSAGSETSASSWVELSEYSKTESTADASTAHVEGEKQFCVVIRVRANGAANATITAPSVAAAMPPNKHAKVAVRRLAFLASQVNVSCADFVEGLLAHANACPARDALRALVAMTIK
jgi:hypothetical protein